MSFTPTYLSALFPLPPLRWHWLSPGHQHFLLRLHIGLLINPPASSLCSIYPPHCFLRDRSKTQKSIMSLLKVCQWFDSAIQPSACHFFFYAFFPSLILCSNHAILGIVCECSMFFHTSEFLYTLFPGLESHTFPIHSSNSSFFEAQIRDYLLFYSPGTPYAHLSH